MKLKLREKMKSVYHDTESSTRKTCKILKCPEACCPGMEILSLDINNGGYCCSHEEYINEIHLHTLMPIEHEHHHRKIIDHVLSEDTALSHEELINNAPNKTAQSSSQKRNEDINNLFGNISHTMGWNHIVMVSGILAAFVVILIIIAVIIFYALRWRRKYLQHVRTDNMVIRHTVGSDRLSFGNVAGYEHVQTNIVACSSTSANTCCTEMINLNEKECLPEDNQSGSGPSTLPSYEELFIDSGIKPIQSA